MDVVRLPIFKVSDSYRVAEFSNKTATATSDLSLTLPSAISSGEYYDVYVEYYAPADRVLSVKFGNNVAELKGEGRKHRWAWARLEPSTNTSTIKLRLSGTTSANATIVHLFIEHTNGSPFRYIAEKWEYHDTVMSSRDVTLTATSNTPLDWKLGDFLIYRGQKYYLNNVPTATQNARPNEAGDAFVYDNVKFDGEQGKMYDCMVLDVTPTTGDYVASKGTNYTGSSVFTIYCAETKVQMQDSGGTWHDVILSPVAYVGGIVQANLNRLYPQDNWRVDVNPELTGLEDKVISFNKWFVPQALAEIHNQWDVDYIVIGNTIKIGYELNNVTGDDSISYTFGFGEGYAMHGDDGKSLFKIKRTANSSQKIITRLRAQGSTRNMPYRYYHTNYELPQSMYINNLQLPDTFLPMTGSVEKKREADPDNKTAGNTYRDSVYGYDADNNPNIRHVLGNTNDAYVDKKDDAASCPEGIREGCAFWDGSDSELEEIYPTIKNGTYRDLRAANIPDMDGRVPSEQTSPTDAYPNYDNDERIDTVLGVDGRANIGDGVMSEVEARGELKVIKTVKVNEKTLSWDASDGGDFEFSLTGSYAKAKEQYRDTLFSINEVPAGDYQMEPVTQNVKVFVKYNRSGIGRVSGAKIRFEVNVYAAYESYTETVASYVSPLFYANRDSFTSFDLPSIPNTDPDTSTQYDSHLHLLHPADVSVQFVLRVEFPEDTPDGSFSYYIDSNDSNVIPEYIWELQQAADTYVNTPFSIYIKDIGVDLKNISTTGEDAIIHFNTGACGGMDFKWNPNTAKEYTETATGKKGWEIEVVERFKDDALHAYYPNSLNPITAGDKYVLLNIEFPDAYIRMAENRLLEAATQYLADNCEQKFIYEPEISDVYIQRNIDICESSGHPELSVYWNLYAGYKFSMRGIPDTANQVLPIISNITIKSVTIREGDQDVPNVEIVLNNEVEQTTLQKLSITVDRIYNGFVGNGGASIVVQKPNLALHELTDVNIKGVSVGQGLVWNGTSWVNSSDIGGGGGSSEIKELVFVDKWLPEDLFIGVTVWDGTSLRRSWWQGVNLMEEAIPLRTDALYIDKQHNKPYRWSGSEMIPLGSNMEISANGSVITIGDQPINFAHNHDWGDIVNKPNLVEGITVGENKLGFKLMNGDNVTADFSSLVTSVGNKADKSAVNALGTKVKYLTWERGMAIQPYVWGSDYSVEDWEDCEGLYWFDTNYNLLKVCKEVVNGTPSFEWQYMQGAYLLWHSAIGSLTGDLILYIYNGGVTSLVTLYTVT